jgi:hypothetical protein
MAYSAEEAAELQAAFQRSIDSEFVGKPDASAEGKVAVTQDGEGYLVTLPKLILGDDEGRVSIDPIRIGLMPGAGDTLAMTATLPTTIPATLGDGTPMGKITLGSQAITGTWSKELQSFTSFSGRLGAIDIQPAGQEAAARGHIDSLAITSAMTPAANARSSGSANVSLDGLAFSGPAASATLRHAELVSNMQNYDAAAYAAANRRLQELSASAADSDAPSAESILAAVAVGRAMGMGEGTLSLSDLKVREGDSATSLDAAHLSFSFGAGAGGTGGIGFGFGHEGLVISPAPEEIDLIPVASNFNVALRDVPMDGFWNLIESWAPRIASGKAEDPAMGQQAGREILALLAQGGAYLELSETNVNAPAYSGAANGRLDFSEHAAYGLQGRVQMVLAGMNALIARMSAVPEEEQTPDMAQTVQMLTLFQAFGQQGQDSYGRETRSYALDITADGGLLLNGTDFRAMLGAAGGGSAPPPQ